MTNRITFANVASTLLENKKKTYPQYELIEDLFELGLTDIARPLDADEEVKLNIKYSNWCTGKRGIPNDILAIYEAPNGWQHMVDTFEHRIIPSLINVPRSRSMMEELIVDSTPLIGDETAQQLLTLQPDQLFFMEVVRYAILSDHGTCKLYSPNIFDELYTNHPPSVTKTFIGRKQELKTAYSILQNDSLLFVNGVVGIGKSEFAKHFASTYAKKYTNIMYLYYDGDLKKCITEMEFNTDTSSMTMEHRFESHYQILEKLKSDSLIILDNFNVLPKDDIFFREFIKNNFHLLVTTRCNIKTFSSLQLSELELDTELMNLFYTHCPSAKNAPDTVKSIIETVNSHTLTVCLAALSLSASGLEPEELLYELQTCGLNIDSSEDIQIYKDGDFDDGMMIEHLRKLIQLSKLTEERQYVLRHLSLLPTSGVLKNTFGKWIQLTKLTDVNALIQYGFIMDDEANKKISLHPLIQEVVRLEFLPSTNNCSTLLGSLHAIVLSHGYEVLHPDNTIQALISIIDRTIIEDGHYFLLFLQDSFPYFDKYHSMDILPQLTDRIAYMMDKYNVNTPCDKALLLDYKAQIFYLKSDYNNALKKRFKAIQLLEKELSLALSARCVNLLSNLYNNVANVYVTTRKSTDATNAMKKALDLRAQYPEFDLIESHDTLQQMGNLIFFYIHSRDTASAKQILAIYEPLVYEKLGTQTIDYATCLLMKGIIASIDQNPVVTEQHLLAAEGLFAQLTGANSEYSKTTYRYLQNLYQRWRKTEKALEYRGKLLGVQKIE